MEIKKITGLPVVGKTEPGIYFDEADGEGCWYFVGRGNGYSSYFGSRDEFAFLESDTDTTPESRAAETVGETVALLDALARLRSAGR